MNEYKNLTNLLRQIGTELRDDYKDLLKTPNAKGYNAIASGKLFNSIEYRLKISEKGIGLYFVAEDYWINVEDGRESYNDVDGIIKSKLPPISVIRKWILNKKLTRTKGIEYKIQRSIVTNGIKARPFLKQVSTNIIKQYRKDINNAIKKDIKEAVVKKTIKFNKIKLKINK